jgi:hypothetical protein
MSSNLYQEKSPLKKDQRVEKVEKVEKVEMLLALCPLPKSPKGDTIIAMVA